MKTQISKPVRDRTSYTDEYKEQALQLWRASGRSAAKVAAELGIRPPLRYRWARTERAPQGAEGGRKRHARPANDLSVTKPAACALVAGTQGSCSRDNCGPPLCSRASQLALD